MASCQSLPDDPRRRNHSAISLFSPHRTGRWAKKVRGKFCYFGKVADDPEGKAALEGWLDQKDDLLAGRTPGPKGDGPSLRDLVNHYLTHKQSLVDSGELAPRTFDRYHAHCALLVGILGRNRYVRS